MFNFGIVFKNIVTWYYFLIAVRSREQYLATDFEIQTADEDDINWTNSFRRIFKERAISIDINWTGALHRMFRDPNESNGSYIDIDWTGPFLRLFNEPKRSVNEGTEFDLTEPLDAIFGDIYAVLENMPTFKEPMKSYSASIIFATTDVLVQHEAKQSKSFDDMKYRGMELAIGAFKCFKKIDRELVDVERSDMVNTRKSEIVAYGQSVTSTLAMVDIA